MRRLGGGNWKKKKKNPKTKGGVIEGNATSGTQHGISDATSEMWQNKIKIEKAHCGKVSYLGRGTTPRVDSFEQQHSNGF